MPSIAQASSSLVVNVVHTGSEQSASYSLPFGETTPISDVLTALSRHQTDPTLILSLSSELRIAVTKGEPCYDARDSRGLLISDGQPIVDWYKVYRRYHGLVPSNRHSRAKVVEAPISPYANNEAPDSSIHVGPARLRFFRTLRVPDNAKTHYLPPGLGTFPVHPTFNYGVNLPTEMRRRGGFLMPMYQREALWISFAGSQQCAVKIAVGGVNALSGLTQDAPNTTQDYVSLPTQPWLDGICTEPGVVRQFVATPVGQGQTVEEQVTGHAQHGGIQIDVYPSLCTQLACFSPDGTPVDITHTPAELRLAPGEVLLMEPRLPTPRTVQDYRRRYSQRLEVLAAAPFSITIELLMKYSTATMGTRLQVMPNDTIKQLKEAIYEQDGVPPSQQQLIFNQVVLDDVVSLRRYGIRDGAVVHMNSTARRSLSPDSAGDHQLGIGAGGKIAQKIYKDTRRVNAYDEECAERVWIHTISTAMWERITGVVAPVSPITFDTYTKCKLPWFSLYDEPIPAVPPTGRLSTIRPIRHLDRFVTQFLDPRNPPRCPQHRDRPARCVVRPCGHLACMTCLDNAISAGTICVAHGCGQPVHAFVGLQEALPHFINAANGTQQDIELHAKALEDGWEGVVTLMLNEDRVALRSPLRRHSTSHSVSRR